MQEGKQKAPAQFVRMPDGTVKVVPVKPNQKPVADLPKKSKKHLKLPKINLSKLKSDSRKLLKKAPKPTRKQLYFIVPIVVVLIGAGVFFISLPNEPKNPSTKVLGQNVAQKPDFKWILPGGSVENIAGKEVKFEPTKKVVLYSDILSNTNIKVSQQALPPAFKDNVNEKVAEYAKKINCTAQIEVQEVMAYAGLSTLGPQTVVFAKKGVLVSIIAEKEINPQAWGTYIASLK